MPEPLDALGLDFGASDWAQHEQLLASVNQPTDIALVSKRLDHEQWEITIAAMDHLGVLSLIAGLMTSLRIDIIRGDALTLSEPSATRKGVGKILNVFVVSGQSMQDHEDWQVVKKELAHLIGLTAAGHDEQAHEEVIDRVSRVMGPVQDGYEPLLPIRIRFDNDSSPALTGLRVSSVVTRGFLFAFTNALSMLQTDIQHAQIRTAGTKVRDAFWIRDAHGRKIESQAQLQRIRTASVLIKQFAYLLPLSADPNQALRQFRDLVKYMLRAAGQHDMDHLHSLDAMRTLAEFMGVSQHLWKDFLRMQHENLFPLVSDPTKLASGRTRAELRQGLQDALATRANDEDKMKCLNSFKDREIFRTDLRHITKRIGIVQFSREISNIAEVVVALAAALCQEQLGRRFGRPLLEAGGPCRWAVLAFGKCGGREMGFASDIELMFVYEGAGHTDGASPVDNQGYFVDLVCQFLNLLQTPEEGIFEIDLRLRPFGKDGLLASSLDAFRKYYSPAGPARQFERMALVKLRCIAGDEAFGAELLKVRDAYVYADHPLDYDNITHLRQRQATELVQNSAVNAKYSQGGLVDLEYFVQANQIEYGRTDRSLRVTNSMQALDCLHAADHLDQTLTMHARRSYELIRRVIDGLRVVRGNAKDLSIPVPDSRAFRYLARRLGYTHSQCLQRDIYNAMALGRSLWQKRSKGQAWTSMVEHTLLVCTDTHARMLLPEIDSVQALAWLHGGDFYMRRTEARTRRPVGSEGLKGFGTQKAAMEQWLARTRVPVYAVRGNHDVRDPWGFFEACQDISGRVEQVTAGLTLAGIGWYGEQFYHLPEEAELTPVCHAVAAQLREQWDPADSLIILSHYPAVTELCPGYDCVNALLAEFKPLVLIQGHIHEAFGKQTLVTWEGGTQTLVVNPGAWGGVLTIQPEAGTAVFEAAQHGSQDCINQG